MELKGRHECLGYAFFMCPGGENQKGREKGELMVPEYLLLILCILKEDVDG